MKTPYVIDIPASKSYTQRYYVASLLSLQQQTLERIARCDDTEYALKCMEALGVQVTPLGHDGVLCDARNVHIWDAQEKKTFLHDQMYLKKASTRIRETISLYVGGSATLLRTLSMVLCSSCGTYALSGNEQLDKREHKTIDHYVRQFSASIEYKGVPRCTPYVLNAEGTEEKVYHFTTAKDSSSQYISGMLFSLMRLPRGSSVSFALHDTVSLPYIVMTLFVLESFGVRLSYEEEWGTEKNYSDILQKTRMYGAFFDPTCYSYYHNDSEKEEGYRQQHSYVNTPSKKNTRYIGTPGISVKSIPHGDAAIIFPEKKCVPQTENIYERHNIPNNVVQWSITEATPQFMHLVKLMTEAISNASIVSQREDFGQYSSEPSAYSSANRDTSKKHDSYASNTSVYTEKTHNATMFFVRKNVDSSTDGEAQSYLKRQEKNTNTVEYATMPHTMTVRTHSINLFDGTFTIPSDWSAASYCIAMGILGTVPLTLRFTNPRAPQGDAIIVDLVRLMGAKLKWEGTSLVCHPSKLYALDVDMRHFPDIVPTLAVIAAFAEGTTIIRGIQHLQYKESNRIRSLYCGLQACNIHTVCDNDALIIHGAQYRKPISTTVAISSFSDHRIAMAFALFQLKNYTVVIDDPSCVTKSFPGFWHIFHEVVALQRP